MRTKRRITIAIAAATALSVTFLAACAPTNSGGGDAETISQQEVDEAMQEEVTLTFWTWLPGAERLAEEFTNQYPSVTVKIENPSGGAGQDALLRTAIQAGTGIPDVSQFSSTVAPFALTENLLDLRPYGAANLEDSIVPTAWKGGVVGDSIFGISTDVGPMAMMYRTDLLADAGIEVPTTWEEFAIAAEDYHAKTGQYLTNFNQLEYLFLGSQSAPSWVEWDGGQDVKIAIDSPESLEWAAYWDDLIDRGLVSTDPELVDNWYQGIANGKYATWLTAAWGQVFLQGTAASTAGNWAVAPLPQTGETTQNVNAGGSFTSVLNTTEHPIQAAVFAMWFASAEGSAVLSELGVFPSTTEQLENEAWLNTEDPFFGGQKVNEVFAAATEDAATNDLGPLTSFLGTASVDEVSASLAQGTGLAEGLKKLQAAAVKYAESQGFTLAE